MTRVYWYAPFNNAGELETAVEVAAFRSIALTVQAVDQRFGQALSSDDAIGFDLVRDLPAPSGEGPRTRTAFDRARVAVERAVRRHRLVRSQQFDIIHLHTFNPITDWLAIPMLRRQAKLVIQSVHNVRPHDSVMPRPIESLALRLGYRSCSTILVAHPVLRDMLVTEMGVPADRVSIMPFALTMPIMPARNHQASGQGPVRFLFFGTLRNNKGVAVLAAALHDLHTIAEGGPPEFTVHIAGRGEPDLEQVVLGLAEDLPNVTAEVGYISNERRDQLYRSADCVLLPYTELQAQSGVLHDAYARRLPVIASDVRALGAAVRSDATGWVVPPSDAPALAAAILHAARSTEERRQKGEQAGVRAEGSTARAVAGRLLDLYRGLAPNIADRTGAEPQS